MLVLRLVSLTLCSGLVLGVAAHAADNTPLNVKPGLWEMNVDSEGSGAAPIPPDVLARMSPEQRAKLEAVMQHAMAPQHRVVKRCVTQADIDKGFEEMEQRDGGKCTHTVTSSTPALRTGSFTCTGRENTSGTYRFEARSPEAVVADWDVTVSNSGKAMRMKNVTQGRWLGADCGSVEPED